MSNPMPATISPSDLALPPTQAFDLTDLVQAMLREEDRV
ncbi:MAG: hypothetical protein JWP70_2099 [Leifsonia sp.]|jgi:hypothetical protein|nr:hypothetical protein [Leifsonia sp.]MDQ1608882.1 hypothetical protein [Microbacteriaceae bacterium]